MIIMDEFHLVIHLVFELVSRSIMQALTTNIQEWHILLSFDSVSANAPNTFSDISKMSSIIFSYCHLELDRSIINYYPFSILKIMITLIIYWMNFPKEYSTYITFMVSLFKFHNYWIYWEHLSLGEKFLWICSTILIVFRIKLSEIQHILKHLKFNFLTNWSELHIDPPAYFNV